MPLFSKVKDIFQRGSSAKKKKVYHNVLLDNPEESWDIVGELGDGAYGKVYKALNKDNKKLAALKLVPLEEEEDLDNFMIEIDILSECQHTNIVQLLEAYHYDGKLWMYLEYCDGGAVDSIMVDLDRPLNEKQIAYICKELLQALKYLHAQKIIHRDMKAGNVLLTMDGGVKLADFGVSAKNKNTMDKRGTFIGTPYWLAPEVILCETFLDAKYDYKADIWSLGITLIELAEMDPPNHEVSPVRVMLKIQKSDPPKLLRANKFSKNFNDFLTKCLVKDPTQRPTADELLSHSFVNSTLEKKPITELLLEYKAEVVVEDVDDESEDHDPSRLSIVTDVSSSGSHLEKSSPDRDVPALNDSSPEEMANAHQERRASKGPAPLPPSTTVQSPTKKGPAPAIPDTSSSLPKQPTPDLQKPTSETSKNIPESPKTTELPKLDIPKAVQPDKSSSSPEPSEQKSPKVSPQPESPIKPEPSSPKSSLEISHKPNETKTPVEPPKSPKVSTEPQLLPESPTEMASSGIADEVQPSDTSTVNVCNTESRESSPEVVSTHKSPPSSPISTPQPKEHEETKVTVNSKSPEPTPLERELSETSTIEITGDTKVDDLEVLATSTGIAGTVVVQSPSSPLPTENPPQMVPVVPDAVTCTVATPQPDEVSTIEIQTGKASPESPPAGESNLSSISEAEADAVLMLDSAIDSAIDTCLKDDSVEEQPSPVRQTSPEPKGSVIVVSPTPTPEVVENKRSSRKLDESEVVICDSSILQEDTNEIPEPKFDVTVEIDDSADQVRDRANISVVAVEEDMPSPKVTDEVPSPVHSNHEEIPRSLTPDYDEDKTQSIQDSPECHEVDANPLQPIPNGLKRQNSKFSEKSDTWSSMGSDKENHSKHDETTEEVELRRSYPNRKNEELARAQEKNKERQDFLALRRKTRKRTRRFEIDGVVVTTTTSKVIYGDDEDAINSNAHLARKQELREIKILQKQEQKQFQELSAKAEQICLEQERKFEAETFNLLKTFDTQIEVLNRQQKQQVEKAEARQEVDLKNHSKKIRAEQERELKSFRESLKQELKMLKYEVNLIPKETRKEAFKVKKEQLDQDQAEREKNFLDKLNETHEISVKRLNDAHREHIALKEKQFLEEKHQLMRTRENALWETEEKHLQDKHQLKKEQLKDIYFLQRHQMLIRHNKELEQVRRMNQQKEDQLLKRQAAEKRQLPKRIRQEMKTREKMFKEKIRISMNTLPAQDEIKRFQEQEKIKYDAERLRTERKHKKQIEELKAITDYAIKELEILQNEKGKLLMEHENAKLKSLDEEYHRDLKSWKSNLMPRKQKLEDSFERQLSEQERFYGEYLNKGLSATPSLSVSSLASSVAGSNVS